MWKRKEAYLVCWCQFGEFFKWYICSHHSKQITIVYLQNGTKHYQVVNSLSDSKHSQHIITDIVHILCIEVELWKIIKLFSILTSRKDLMPPPYM